MSRIYEALEKAERERKSTGKNVESEKKTIGVGPIPFVEETPEVRKTPGVVKTQGTEKIPTVQKAPISEKPGDRAIMPPTRMDALAAEEFRKLRTMILHTSASKPMQAILVTSALPGEGKSTVASNLALVISQGIKEHALLIDCDLRNSSFSPFINRSKPLGLSDYLMGKLDPAKLIVRTGAPKLSVVPSGSITSNPAELVGSEKMRDLVAALKSRYANRYIIIDGPPITLTTEPVLLSEMVDGVIVVVLAGKTPREVVQRAANNIKKEKILGVVLNQIDTKSSSYHSRYYFRYYHHPGKKG
jgi:capsular exopolysaccharide synthesis family protein